MPDDSDHQGTVSRYDLMQAARFYERVAEHYREVKDAADFTQAAFALWERARESLKKAEAARLHALDFLGDDDGEPWTDEELDLHPNFQSSGMAMYARYILGFEIESDITLTLRELGRVDHQPLNPGRVDNLFTNLLLPDSLIAAEKEVADLLRKLDRAINPPHRPTPAERVEWQRQYEARQVPAEEDETDD